MQSVADIGECKIGGRKLSVYRLLYWCRPVGFFFFFFKQKTAYEFLYGLVGSEMCIRDRPERGAGRVSPGAGPGSAHGGPLDGRAVGSAGAGRQRAHGPPRLRPGPADIGLAGHAFAPRGTG